MTTAFTEKTAPGQCESDTETGPDGTATFPLGTSASSSLYKTSGNLQDAALRIAGRGWHVFPVRPKDKVPYPGTHGHLEATTDSEQIKRWWGQRPSSNIGIACGPSKLVVIDVDVVKGGGESLAVLRQTMGDAVFNTLTAKTGTDGRHYYYKAPEGVTVGNATNLAGYKGIDVRGDGGFVVAAPSIHPNGNAYEWLNPATEAAPLPPALAEVMSRKSAAPIPLHPVDTVGAIPQGERNHRLTQMAGKLRRDGHSSNIIAAMLSAVNREQCNPPLPENEVQRIAESVGRYSPAPTATTTPTPTPAPVVQQEYIANNADLADAVRIVWRVLRESNTPPRLFLRGDSLVRLDDAEKLVPMGIEALRYELAYCAKWVKRKGNESSASKPDKDTAAVALTQLHLSGLPKLRRIAHCPTFTRDGVLRQPGYTDEVLTVWQGTAEPLPLAEAKALLSEWLCDFPFEGEADHLNAIALYLLPFVRDCIGGPTPLHALEAPVQGSGKSLLAEALLIPALGKAASTTSPAYEDELRKRLSALLIGGAEAIMIDNLDFELRSATLAGMITAREWTERILGRSETITVPVSPVWLITANNGSLSTDLARRSIRIRLDPKLERPWERSEFLHPDLIEWTQQHRHRLVGAALALVQNWLAAGRPAAAASLGGFGQWARVVGGILEAAGYTGFLANQREHFEAASAEATSWAAFIGQWAETHGTDALPTADLLPMALECDVDVKGDNPAAQKKSLGRALRDRRGRRYGDWTISAGEETHAKRRLWTLVRVVRVVAGSHYPFTRKNEGDIENSGAVVTTTRTPRTTRSDETCSICGAPKWGETSDGSAICRSCAERGLRVVQSQLPAQDQGVGEDDQNYPQTTRSSGAQVAFMITAQQRRDLLSLGYTSAEIDNMKPGEANDLLSLKI